MLNTNPNDSENEKKKNDKIINIFEKVASFHHFLPFIYCYMLQYFIFSSSDAFSIYILFPCDIISICVIYVLVLV